MGVAMAASDCTRILKRRTGNHNPIALPKRFRLGPGEPALQLFPQGIDLLEKIAGKHRDIIFISKIKHGLHRRRQFQQPFAPLFNLAREGSPSHGEGSLPLQFSLGRQQICQPFGFGKVDPAIGKGPPRKLPWFRCPQVGQFAQPVHHGGDYRPAPVQVEFRRILASGGLWARQP
jgi:hypothetical protein